MRYTAFSLFLAATFWFMQAVSAFLTLSPDEHWHYFRSSKSPAELQSAGTFGFVRDARKARLREATRSALLSAAFLSASFCLFFPNHRKHRPCYRRAPHPVDLTSLVNNVKNHPMSFAPPLGVPHFFASRRARCRAAQSKLAAKMNAIFHHANPSDIPSLPDNP